MLSAIGIGLFYVFCSYAWVIGTGFGHFTKVTTASANPWQDLAVVFWGAGWVLVFFAIINSALANANAGVNAATRIIYSMGRNGILPRAFARTHPVHKTPHVAIYAQTAIGLAVSLLTGWKWGPLVAFQIIAVAVTIVVITVYMTICFATIVYYTHGEAEREFNPWLHWVFPLLGAAAFVPPLYYQYFPLPPYPFRYANWIALGWLAAGALMTAFVPRERLANAERVFIEERVVGLAGPDVPPPEPAPAPAF